MTAKGLTVDESKIISIIAPLIALIGPAVAGPLADRFAGSFGGSAKSTSGTYLRVFTAICLICAAIFYSCLAAIPTIVRFFFLELNINSAVLLIFNCSVEVHRQ